MRSSPKPVLLLGENHRNDFHHQMEERLLLPARREGYDTLALELAEDWEAPLQEYLDSPRSYSDARRLEAALWPQERSARLPDMSPFSVAALAFDLGYRVLCVDLPQADYVRASVYSREKGGHLAEMNRRNRHMAARLAREIEENGARIILTTGRSHILSHWPGREKEKGDYVPLPMALKDRGIASRSAVFPGPSVEESLRKSRTPARLLSTLEEAEAFPRFRRPGHAVPPERDQRTR